MRYREGKGQGKGEKEEWRGKKRRGWEGGEEKGEQCREKEMDVNITSDHMKTAITCTFALIWNSSCSISRSSAVSTEVPRSTRLWRNFSAESFNQEQIWEWIIQIREWICLSKWWLLMEKPHIDEILCKLARQADFLFNLVRTYYL